MGKIYWYGILTGGFHTDSVDILSYDISIVLPKIRRQDNPLNIMLIGAVQSGKTKLAQLLTQCTFEGDERRSQYIDWQDPDKPRLVGSFWGPSEKSNTPKITPYVIKGTGVTVVDTPGIVQFSQRLKEFYELSRSSRVEISWKSFAGGYIVGTSETFRRPDAMILVLEATKEYEQAHLLNYVDRLSQLCTLLLFWGASFFYLNS